MTTTTSHVEAKGREEEPRSMQNLGWQVEVDRATSAEWSRMLDLFNDANIYQTPAYGGVRWGEKNLSRLVLKRNGEVLGMAQLRIIRPTPFKFGMAYLRWGPLFERRGRPLDPEVASRMARALEEEYVAKRKLFLRVLPNAFVGSARAEAIRSGFSSFRGEPSTADNTYRTFVLDLGLSLEELRKNLDSKWRNKLSGAEKNNLRIVAGNGIEEYKIFCQLFYEMWRRKKFETTVDVEEFRRMQELLAEPNRMQVLICQNGEIPVVGLVASAIGDSAIYLLGATSDEGLNTKGAYLLQWTLIKWLKEKGIRWYDLGGIDPKKNPGVYSFKKGLSAVDVCQLNPLVACESVLSSGIIRVGLAMQRVLRNSRSVLNLGRAFTQFATRN